MHFSIWIRKAIASKKKLMSEFQKNCQKEGRADRRTDLNSQDPYGHSQGSN